MKCFLYKQDRNNVRQTYIKIKHFFYEVHFTYYLSNLFREEYNIMHTHHTQVQHTAIWVWNHTSVKIIQYFTWCRHGKKIRFPSSGMQGNG